MHPNEIDFTQYSLAVVPEYQEAATLLGKKYEEALTEQLTRQGVITKKTKLQA